MTNRRAMTTTLIAFIAAALGVGVGLAIVGLGLLPDPNQAATDTGTPVNERCPAGEETQVLRIAAAPEIAPAVTDLADRAGDMEEALRCHEVEVVSTPPSQVRAALTRGWVESTDGPPPHVWIATTTTEVHLARGTSSVGDMLPAEPTSIATSPQVIAMPQPMAEVLGWPDTDITWNAVAKLAAADNAWAERNQPDWGAFELRLVEGVEAEPSMNAVAALTRAVGALPSGAESSEEASQREFEARAQLLLLERRIDYVGDTTQAQLEALREADDNGELLQTVSALPLTEQMAWQYNRGGPDGDEPPATPLSVWYPSDGAPDADYPFAVVNGSWATQASNMAAGAFLDLLQSADAKQRLQQYGFRDNSRQATPQLSQEGTIQPDMAPPEPDAVPTLIVGPLLQAWRGLSQTGNLLAVVDVSGSMKTEVPGTGASRLELSAQGLAAGVALLDPKTSGGVWEFSTDLDGEGVDHRELVPLGEFDDDIGGVSRQEAAIAAIQSLEPKADTGLYDTIAAAYEQMLDSYEPGRLNAVIFFTDGRNDDDNGITLQQLQERLRDMVDPERPVLFLGVGYGPEADFEALNAVTSITDGKLYVLERPEDIRNVFIDVQTGGVG